MLPKLLKEDAGMFKRNTGPTIWAIFLIVLGACGNNPDSSKNPVEPKNQLGPSSFDIKDTWRVTSKSCNGVTVAAKAHEAYKIDRDHFVSIEKISEDESSLCKIGYVYDRIINSFETTSSESKNRYNETAILKGSQAKKTCWRKEAGSVVLPPTSEDVVQFGPQQLEFKLAATAEVLSIDLAKPTECPQGTLHLTLAK